MIFYKNLKKQRQSEEKNLVFSIFNNGVVSSKDDSVVGAAECKNFYNFRVEDGALKTGLGFKDFSVPANEDDLENQHSFDFAEKIDEITGIWMAREFNDEIGFYYQLLFTDSVNKLWLVPLIDMYEGIIWPKSIKLKSFPLSVCPYRIDNIDANAFFTAEGMVYFEADSEATYSDVPPLISCVVHYDNFFGITNTNRNTLIYTKNLNLKNWSAGDNSTIEFLDNRGAFCKLVAFNDYVYLFREYGITKISLYTSKDDFAFTHLYTSTSKIFENSVCVCGENVFFLTREGLYTFNGNSVDKVAEEFDKYFQNFDNRNCSSACLNGKYYIATKCNFDDGATVGCEEGEFVNNALFEIDILTFDVNIYRGVDIRKVLTIDNPFMSKLCACFNFENKQRVGELVFSGQTFEKTNKKCWKSFATDLGFQAKKKKIKKISLFSRGKIDVEIKSDIETKTYSFDGKLSEQCLSVSVLGNIFEFSFKTDDAICDVKKPMVTFDVVK